MDDPLTTMLNFSKSPTVTYNYFYRSLHRVDWALFKQDLSQLSNSLLSNCLNPHYLASSDLKLSLLLNKHAPLKTVVRRKSIRNNYVLSHDALEAKKNVDAWKESSGSLAPPLLNTLLEPLNLQLKWPYWDPEPIEGRTF